MSKLTFLRRPLKPLLIAVLLVLSSTAVFVFYLQSFLDGLVMEHYTNSAAYVGTLYSRLQKYPLLKDIPAGVLQELEGSDTVEDVMAVPVYSARAEGLTYVTDGFGDSGNESLNKKLFLEGIVAGKPDLSPYSSALTAEMLTLNIISVWGGHWSGNEIMVTVFRDFHADEPLLKEGDHVFLVGRYGSNANGDVNGMVVYAPEARVSVEFETDSAFWNHSILILPENADAEESTFQIEEFLLETGLEESRTIIGQIQDMFAVHEVEDMSMLLTVVDGTTFVTQGRELRPSDAGSRVCVLHEAVAAQNGLAVGDTVRLSIASGCYIYDSGFEELLGWNSGYPFEGDTLLEYRGYGEFEIVGLYTEIGRRAHSGDYRHHNRNDIFIPGGILPAPTAGVQARAMTFRVLGPNYEDFMDEFEVPLNEQGYVLNLADSGWEAMSGSFYAMSDRRALMAACAAVALVAAVLSFDALLSSHFRYEFALRRLLGAYPGEAVGIYISGFFATAVPAVLASVGCSFCVYRLWMKGQAAAALPGVLPADGRILAYLAGWACVELAAAFAVLMAFAFAARKRSLIRLLK